MRDAAHDNPPDGRSTELVLRGEVTRVTFRNPENGYSVFRVSLAGSAEPVTVVGRCAEREASVGAHVIIRGTYAEHPKFGRQFAATAITETVPSSPDEIARYLGSGLIKGIGLKTAKRIVERFGESAIEVIVREPEKLASIPGLGGRRGAALHEALARDESDREALRFLLEHNIPRGLADKICKAYAARTIEVLKRDPYLLARQVRGVGFATADSIAMNIGISPDAPQRLTAGLYYALEKAADDGHCHLRRDELFTRTRMLLGVEDRYDLDPALATLVDEQVVLEHEDGISLRYLRRAEEFVADFIARRCEPLAEPRIGDRAIEGALARAESTLDVEFSAEQREAVRAASRYPLLIITGGPGCGKTTIIRALTTMFSGAGLVLSLAAPTGRAAQRMAEVCGLPASTIHRLLRYDPIQGGFVHGLNDPLTTDVVIVDEASMIDVSLARDLFAAIPANATLILVGDKDQLPSVGPGRVFSDLISLREVKAISLSRLFRRSGESEITSIAHMINSGVVPDIPEPDGQTKSDAYFLHRSDPEEAAALVEKLVSEQLSKKFGFSAHEIVVLTPSNRGPLGAVLLNKRLQEALNPSGRVDTEQELAVGDGVLRVGDRVCQRVNNYQLDDIGVFNGDTGYVHTVDSRKRSLEVELWDGRLIRYERGDLHQLSLAYAITVHRSQGSEIPCVVLVLHDSHYALLERQLIYTAVTRAKRLLVVVGSKRALVLASKRATASKRLTSLAKLVRALAAEPQ